jgi:hypothetical protein
MHIDVLLFGVEYASNYSVLQHVRALRVVFNVLLHEDLVWLFEEHEKALGPLAFRECYRLVSSAALRHCH